MGFLLLKITFISHECNKIKWNTLVPFKLKERLFKQMSFFIEPPVTMSWNFALVSFFPANLIALYTCQKMLLFLVDTALSSCSHGRKMVTITLNLPELKE